VTTLVTDLFRAAPRLSSRGGLLLSFCALLRRGSFARQCLDCRLSRQCLGLPAQPASSCCGESAADQSTGGEWSSCVITR
jgi:hypothetical protein